LIQWNALAGAKKYDIWIASLDQPSRPAIRVTTATAVTSYRPNALPAGRYQVWVRGIAQDDTPGDWSAAKVFRSRMVPVLQQNWSYLGIGFHVPYSWALEHEQEAQAYDVWIDDPAQGLTPASSAVRTNFTTGYLEIKTIGTYRIWVRAIGPDGAVGAWSAPLVARVDVAPGQLTFNSADVTKPEVRWSSVTGAVRYDVRVTSKQDGSEILTARKNSTGSPVTAYKFVTSLPIGNYEVTVRAIAADGTVGSWSTPMAYNSTLAPELRPYQPRLGADVMLEWWPAENSGPIDVLVMNTRSKKFVYSGQASPGQYGAAVVLPDGNYRWWVMSTTHQMWSLPGEFEVKRRTSFTNDTSFQTNSAVTLSWGSIPAAARYDVWVTDERGVPVYRNMSATTLQVTLQSTLLPGRYRAWVRAVSEDGDIAPWSSRLDFVVQPIT
jgi:predicted phage tail protein